jgi:Domain of unknown function (DUF4157)/Bacterial SH3 domain
MVKKKSSLKLERANFVNSRASKKLEQQADAHMEGLRRPEFDVNTNPLAAISEHFIAKSNQNVPTRAFEREQHIVQAVRPAPSNLIRTARASGFKTSQLTSAIQRFTDPTANKAVRTGIMTGLHNSPSLSLEVQRSLEASDVSLEVQRQEFLTEARESENNSSLSERIANELNGGQPLEENVRKQLEAHFNTDLSKVRVHTDGKAHELAKTANATAFTTGQNIFFQTGKYDPNSSSGFELLAHETAHTIQQASGLVSPGVDTSSSLESDAKLEGQKAVGNKTNLERQANNFNDFLLKPNLENQPSTTPRASQRFRATHATTRAIQRQVDQDATETPVAKTAFVREEGLNLRSKPDQKSPSNGSFAVGTRVFVISKTGEWLKVLVDGAKTGYMLASKIHGLQPQHQAMLEKDPGLRLFRVSDGETGMGLVHRAYGITGAEGSKDQNLWHFLNVIRKNNQASAFGFKGKGFGDAAQNFFIPGADANNVMLKAKVDLWIPSFAIAAKDNSVGSGTARGEITRLGKNIEQKVKDFQAAQTYAKAAMGPVFAKRLGEGAQELIEGLITTLIAAAGLLVATTAIGAIIGAFAGGVGAAPGAALGFEIGMWLLQWLGLGFLVAWGVGKLGQVFGALGTFVSKVWNANGDQTQLQEAGVALADSLAILAVTALQILVTIGIAKGLGAATRGLANSRFGKAIGIPKLTAYLKGKLEGISNTAGSTPTTARVQQGLQSATPKAVAAKVMGKNNKAPVTPTTGGRVRSPVQGLYDSVDVNTPPKGWRFQDDLVENKTTGIRNLITEVTGPKNETGVFERAYNPSTQQLELKNAFLQNLPKWVDDAAVPLVDGTGTPTVTYMTIYQMRKLGVNFGELKTVKMSTIQNIEAILQLESLVRKGLPRDKAILQTHSVQYADTPIIQSGHEIVSAKVETKGAWTDKTIDYLMKHYENGDPVKISYHDGLLQKYGLQRTDKVLMNYDIYLKVQPLKPGSIAKSIGGN